MIKTAILFVLMMLVLVIPHEWGHMMVAKLCGVKVKEFSVGMGPLLFQRQGKETMYSVRALPLGGFCAMEGEEEAVDSPTSYSSKTNPQKVAILLAGVTMNLIIAVLVSIIVVSINGFPSNTLEMISEGSPAEKVGLMAGDTIIEIDGTEIKNWDGVIEAIDAAQGMSPLHFVVERDGKTIEYDIVPEYLEEENRYIVGIVSMYKRDLLRSVPEGVKFARELGLAFVNAILSMFRNGVSPDDVSGPVGLVRAVDQTASYGATSYLMLLVIVSLNLAFFNLLPIPGLDGGKIFFILLKLISRGKITDDMEYKATLVGMIILISLVVLITFNDVKNLMG